MPGEIASNRRAYHDFHILEKLEAGIELKGTEVKSIRAGLANLNNAFAKVENTGVFLHDADIQPYVRASHEQHAAKRKRRLLLHKGEIARLFEASAVKGHTLVALRLYWKDQHVKLELGVAQGKNHGDKRADLKEKVERREAERAISAFNRRRG